MTRQGLALFLALWLAVGGGGKLLRYAPARESAAPRTERLVREFLAARGWTLAGRSPITRAGLYSAQLFTRPGCTETLRVAVVGNSSEASEVVLAGLGADTAFLNDGRFSARPATNAFAAQVLRASLSLSADWIMLPVAVAPAPRIGDRSSCAPPVPDEWAQIDAGGRL